MRDLLLLVVHLLVTLARLAHPGGARSVVTEFLLLKHPLIIRGRSRRRAPPLTTVDRFALGLTTLSEMAHVVEGNLRQVVGVRQTSRRHEITGVAQRRAA